MLMRITCRSVYTQHLLDFIDDVITCQARTVHVLLTRAISEVIRCCSDRHSSFVSPRDQRVYHWFKIRDQVGSVHVLYRSSVAKSGNSRFHAWRIFKGVGLFIVNKSVIENGQHVYERLGKWLTSRPYCSYLRSRSHRNLNLLKFDESLGEISLV